MRSLRLAVGLDAESARAWINADGRLVRLARRTFLSRCRRRAAICGVRPARGECHRRRSFPGTIGKGRRASGRYDVAIRPLQADMRDLSQLKNESFDIVHQPYSINFVPDCTEVFAEVSRLLRPGGLYWLAFGNPFTMSTRQSDWNDGGYVLREPYLAGAKITYADQGWVYDRENYAAIEQPVNIAIPWRQW